MQRSWLLQIPASIEAQCLYNRAYLLNLIIVVVDGLFSAVKTAA